MVQESRNLVMEVKVPDDITTDEFRDRLREQLSAMKGLPEYTLSDIPGGTESPSKTIAIQFNVRQSATSYRETKRVRRMLDEEFYNGAQAHGR